jgi:hypothetical protein
MPEEAAGGMGPLVSPPPPKFEEVHSKSFTIEFTARTLIQNLSPNEAAVGCNPALQHCFDEHGERNKSVVKDPEAPEGNRSNEES